MAKPWMTPQEYHSQENWSLSSKEYWAIRSSRRVLLAEKQSERKQLEVIKIYEKSLRNINSLLNDVYRRYADKTGLDVSELTQVLKGGEKSQAIQDIQKRMQSLGFDIKDIYRPEYLAEISRLEALKQQVYWEIQSIAPKEIETLEPMYRDVIDRAYRETRADIRRSGSLSAFGTINKRDVDSILDARWVGGNWSSRIWKNTELLATRAKQVIGGGLVSGYSNQRMARELRETFDVGTYRSMRLVRTEVNFVRGQSELQSYIDDGIEWYRYQAVMDSRTSELCEEQHDEIYKVSEAQVGENYPPLHPNCRSTTVVVFEDEVPAKLRRVGDNKPYHRRDLVNVETEEEIQQAYEEYKRTRKADRVPITVQDLEKRWGNIDRTRQEGGDPYETKLLQGGDKALNAEAEWIMNRARYTTDPTTQMNMTARLDEIIRDMQDEGQRQQVQMVKDYMSFPSRDATPFDMAIGGKRVEVALEKGLKDFIDKSGVKITELPDPAIRGAYHPELNELALNPNIPDHLVDRTIKHEIGHLVDYKLEGKPQSDSKEFRRVAYNGGSSISDEAFAIVQARLEGKSLMGFDEGFRVYVQKPDEVFAEGFRQYIQTPKEMKQYAPEMYEYYEGVYKKLGGERLPQEKPVTSYGKTKVVEVTPEDIKTVEDIKRLGIYEIRDGDKLSDMEVFKRIGLAEEWEGAMGVNVRVRGFDGYEVAKYGRTGEARRVFNDTVATIYKKDIPVASDADILQGDIVVYRAGEKATSRKTGTGLYFTSIKEYAETYEVSQGFKTKGYLIEKGAKVYTVDNIEVAYMELTGKRFPVKGSTHDEWIQSLRRAEVRVATELRKKGYDILHIEKELYDNGFKNGGYYADSVVLLNNNVIIKEI